MVPHHYLTSVIRLVISGDATVRAVLRGAGQRDEPRPVIGTTVVNRPARPSWPAFRRARGARPGSQAG